MTWFKSVKMKKGVTVPGIRKTGILYPMWVYRVQRKGEYRTGDTVNRGNHIKGFKIACVQRVQRKREVTVPDIREAGTAISKDAK